MLKNYESYKNKCLLIFAGANVKINTISVFLNGRKSCLQITIASHTKKLQEAHDWSNNDMKNNDAKDNYISTKQNDGYYIYSKNDASS